MRVKFQMVNNNLPSKGEQYFITYWDNVEIIPNINDSICVEDFISDDDYGKLLDTCELWSGSFADVTTRMLRKDDEGWYYEIIVNCDDF